MKKKISGYGSMCFCMYACFLRLERKQPVGHFLVQHRENTDNKEETVSEEAIEKKDSGKIEDEITEVQDTVTVAADTDVLDYPGRKEGSVIGEVLEEDESAVQVLLMISGAGFCLRMIMEKNRWDIIPTSVLEGYEDKNQVASDATSDGTVEAGIIHKSTGEGVFAEAIEGVTQTGGTAGVLEGQPIMVSADSSLRPLGVFHITHYCQCSICCGPWANGITSTGVTATTNRTIAVDPTVIPYGSKSSYQWTGLCGRRLRRRH